jgi:hypothetical protein
MARFKQGNTFGKGRPKGSRSKVNVDIRECFSWAFEQAGGREELAKWAKTNRKTFYQIYAKLAPKEVDMNVRQQEAFIETLANQELIEEAQVMELQTNSISSKNKIREP